MELLLMNYFNYGRRYGCGCVHVSAGMHKNQKRAPDTQKLKLQVVVSHIAWVVVTELQFSRRTT